MPPVLEIHHRGQSRPLLPVPPGSLPPPSEVGEHLSGLPPVNPVGRLLPLHHLPVQVGLPVHPQPVHELHPEQRELLLGTDDRQRGHGRPPTAEYATNHDRASRTQRNRCVNSTPNPRMGLSSPMPLISPDTSP